jgi:hypothetical protein
MQEVLRVFDDILDARRFSKEDSGVTYTHCLFRSIPLLQKLYCSIRDLVSVWGTEGMQKLTISTDRRYQTFPSKLSEIDDGARVIRRSEENDMTAIGGVVMINDLLLDLSKDVQSAK